MKKLYSFCFLLILCFFFHRSGAQVLTFSFAGSNGDESNWPSTTQASGVLPSAISRGPGIVAAANADRFNSKNWTTATTIDLNDYLEFTITPCANCSVSLTSLLLQHQRSSYGPRSFVIRTSLDGFAADATNTVTVADVNTNLSNAFTFSPAISTTAPLTVRIYGYNAKTVTGTWGPGESADGNDIVLSGSQQILPLKFVSVSASWKSAGVEVTWSNATESNLLYYSVERSGDGQTFSELKKVYPTHNNSGLSDYRSLDAQPLNKINFYRIKAVESNGHASYTQIVRVETGLTSVSMGLYPNPATANSEIAVRLTGLKEGTYEIGIYNAAAQLIRRETITVNGFSSAQSISLTNVQKGMYVAEINGAQSLRQQFVVQ